MQTLHSNQIDPAIPLENRKHEEFCFKYLLCGIATDAYMEVYPVARDVAQTCGSRLLTQALIRNRVDFMQRAQTDLAFSTIVRNFHAKKTIVHDPDAVLTEVDDPQAQIAAATAMLKANGRLGNDSAPSSNITNNYNVLAINQVVTLGNVVDRLMSMNSAIDARKSRESSIIEKHLPQNSITQENLT